MGHLWTRATFEHHSNYLLPKSWLYKNENYKKAPLQFHLFLIHIFMGQNFPLLLHMRDCLICVISRNPSPQILKTFSSMRNNSSVEWPNVIIMIKLIKSLSKVNESVYFSSTWKSTTAFTLTAFSLNFQPQDHYYGTQMQIVRPPVWVTSLLICSPLSKEPAVLFYFTPF